MPAPPPAAPPQGERALRAGDTSDRRSFWIAGIVLATTIAILTAVTVLTTSYGPRHDRSVQLEEQGGAKPHIIPRPGEGKAPQHANDRGGWQQFMVLALIVAGLASVGGLAWRSSRRSRAAAVPVASAPRRHR